MREFYEFDEERYRRRSNVKIYIVIALIFALLGGAIAYSAYPYLASQDRLADNQTNNLPGEQDQKDNEDSSVAALGYVGDLFINSDNPVVDIADKVGKAVVGITSTTEVVVPDFFFNVERTQEVDGTGSGIIISEEGHILTNNHVIQNAKKLYVILHDGEKVEAKLVGTDPQSDIAVLKIDYDNLTVAKIGDSDKVRKGEFAVTIGNPLGHELAGTVNFGVISNVDRTLNIDGKALKLLQTDASINQGNSGGALVNMKGEVIGMNTAKVGGNLVEGLGFAIPANVFKPIAKELIETGKVKQPEKPWLGVGIQEVNEAISREYGYHVGVLITDVYPDSPAAVGGIKPGDVIVGIGNDEVLTIDALKSIVGQHKVGDVLDVKLFRQDTDFVLKIKLGDMNNVGEK